MPCPVVSRESLRAPRRPHCIPSCSASSGCISSQPRLFRCVPHHGAGAAQVPGAEAGEEQGGGGGLRAEPRPEEGWSCHRPQEGTHRAAAKAQEGPGGRDPEEDRT